MKEAGNPITTEFDRDLIHVPPDSRRVGTTTVEANLGVRCAVVTQPFEEGFRCTGRCPSRQFQDGASGLQDRTHGLNSTTAVLGLGVGVPEHTGVAGSSSPP
jgi:hypothetical protein